MRKNVWIFNHYATDTFFDKGGRHYWFAKYLKKSGYNPTVFCASTVHGFDTEINTHGKVYTRKRDDIEGIQYVFIKTQQYKGNGVSRIKNMYAFYKYLPIVAKDYAKKYDTPDIILASSVHPLTLVAGLKVARRLGIKCICEVRDLWPESIVAYGKLSAKSFLAKILYAGERWIYKKADALIFTMEGGKDYIKDKGWDKKGYHSIDLKKVYYINNGIDLPEVIEQRKKDIYVNEQFDSIKCGKIIYTGSIREVNDVGKILDVAKLLKDLNVTFCIFGDGEDRPRLEKRVADENIENVVFFGKVDKCYIPYIVSDALLLLLYSQDIVDIAKYGMSQNKFFDYLTSGKPIISNLPNRYSIINKYRCGIEESMPTASDMAERIQGMLKDEKKLEEWGNNSANTAKEFSFEEHTKKLIQIIEKI